MSLNLQLFDGKSSQDLAHQDLEKFLQLYCTEKSPFNHLLNKYDHHILVGPRGSGKTALMIAVSNKLNQSKDNLSFIFPLDITFRNLDPADFLKELVIRLLNRLFRELRNRQGSKFNSIEKKILEDAKLALYDELSGLENVKSLFDFTKVLRTQIQEIRERHAGDLGGKIDLKVVSVGAQKSEVREFVSSVSPGLGFPSRFFNEIILAITEATKISFYIFLDDIDLVARLSPEKQAIIFDFLRNTKGIGVTFTVAICPPVYYFGGDFDVTRDATQVSLIRDELNEQQYLNFFEELMLARLKHIGNFKSPNINEVFTEKAFILAAFGAMGNPSAFLDISKYAAEEALNKGNKTITVDDIKNALIEWTRTVENSLLELKPFEIAIFRNLQEKIRDFNKDRQQESSIYFSLLKEIADQDEIIPLLHHLIFHRVIYLRNPVRKIREFPGKQYGYNFGMAYGKNLISRPHAVQATKILKVSESKRTIEIRPQILLEGIELSKLTAKELGRRDEVARMIEMFQEVNGIGAQIAKNIVKEGIYTFENFLENENKELEERIYGIGKKNIISIRDSMTNLIEFRLQRSEPDED